MYQGGDGHFKRASKVHFDAIRGVKASMHVAYGFPMRSLIDRPPPYPPALQLRVLTLGQVNNDRAKFQARTFYIPSSASSHGPDLQ
ncbi:hypothetical protein EXIGLDRAFT_737208, partial [Exidia glandulosa HHB12029]